MFISKKAYLHRTHKAWEVYRELKKTEAELERVKHERDLAEVCCAGFANMAERAEKEAFECKCRCEREARINSKLKMQNAKLWKRLLKAISADQIEKEGLTNEAED